MTFTRASSTSYQEMGVERTGSLTVTVNAKLDAGPSDTVSVTAETLFVDTHSAKREMALDADIIKAIPTVRSYNALLIVVPGVVTNVNDVVTGTTATAFPIHGGPANEGRLLLDGLTVGSPPSANSPTNYVVDVGNAQEVVFTTGALGEVETAGLVMNIVPKTGGNSLHGWLFCSGTGRIFQSDNLTPALRAQGLMAATPLTSVYDISGAPGGTIVRDRAWYFVNAHTGRPLAFSNVRSCTGATPGLAEPYSAWNSSAVLTYNNAFVPSGTWLQPVTILTPRLIKLTAEFEF